MILHARDGNQHLDQPKADPVKRATVAVGGAVAASGSVGAAAFGATSGARDGGGMRPNSYFTGLVGQTIYKKP